TAQRCSCWQRKSAFLALFSFVCICAYLCTYISLYIAL
ncbi:E5a protein, partial [Omikronpapillomavirus 1]